MGVVWDTDLVSQLRSWSPPEQGSISELGDVLAIQNKVVSWLCQLEFLWIGFLVSIWGANTH